MLKLIASLFGVVTALLGAGVIALVLERTYRYRLPEEKFWPLAAKIIGSFFFIFLLSFLLYLNAF